MRKMTKRLGLPLIFSSLLLGLLACKKDRNIEIEDTPKAPRSSGSTGRGDSFGRGGGGTPVPEPEALETNVSIDVKARTAAQLTVEQRLSKAELALMDMKDQLALGAEASRVQGLNTKWDIALTSLSAVPKDKPETAIKSFCTDVDSFIAAVMADSVLPTPNKAKISDAYVRLVSKGEGLCAP